MALELHIIEAAWADHADTLRQIRETVFIEEQEVPREIEWDGEDEHSTHFLAINQLGQYIGCARLLPSGQIGRMAVLEEHRGTGVGAALLKAAIEAAKTKGFDRLFLHAQSYAQEFYRKGGFLPYGKEFDEADIPHIAMEMKLPVAYAPPADVTDTAPRIRPERVRPSLSVDVPQTDPFQGFTECSAALTKVLQSARRRVLILSPYLDHELFDKPAVVDALSELARSAPRVEIKILIFDSKLIVDRGHRIIELARRLDEKIKIRVLGQLPNAESSSFVCADLDAYWLLPAYDKHDGVCDLANPVTNRRLSEVFDTAWAKSSEDTELRTLRL